MFVTFEGYDGSGKTCMSSTVASMLKEDGYPVFGYYEPGGTGIGREIRSMLKSSDDVDAVTRLWLFEASRTALVPRIKEDIDNGIIVFCDRFTDSTVAYQGYGCGIDIGLISLLNEKATNGLEPDLTFYLEASVEKERERILRRNKELGEHDKDDMEFHRKVRNGFQELARNNDRIITIDADQMYCDVYLDIYKQLKPYVEANYDSGKSDHAWDILRHRWVDD